MATIESNNKLKKNKKRYQKLESRYDALMEKIGFVNKRTAPVYEEVRKKNKSLPEKRQDYLAELAPIQIQESSESSELDISPQAILTTEEKTLFSLQTGEGSNKDFGLDLDLQTPKTSDLEPIKKIKKRKK